MFWKAIFSVLHNALALTAATLVPLVANTVAGGPTGGALSYAGAHPWIMPFYAVAAMMARDLLKGVPAFAGAAGAVASTSAEAAVGTGVTH